MFRSSLTTQVRVIGALILRDMRTRFGRSHWGFIIAAAWPFAHIFLVAGIMVFRGMPTPLGHSVTLFATTGLVPYIGFMYISRKSMEAVIANKPLLYFPQVKSIDIIIARCSLEIIAFFGTAIFCCIFLILIGVDPMPPLPGEAIYAVLGMIILSVGLGMVNACLASLYPPYIMGYVLIIIAIYSVSGIFFVPEFLPKQLYDLLSWNPVLQCVIWFRSAYYPGYGVDAAKEYVLGFGLTLLGVGLILDRFLLRKIA